MLKGIKELPELKQKVDSIENQIKELQVIKQKQEHHESKLQELHSLLLEIKENNQGKLEEADHELQKLSSLTQSFEKLLRRFQHEHGNTAETMFRSLSNKVDDHLNIVSKNTKSFKTLEPEVKGLVSQLVELRNETSKLTKTSKKINEMDFELKNYAKALKDADTEKLKLMKDVSNLKRLIAKERRQR